MRFESKIIPAVKLKINGRIKKAVEAYKKKKGLFGRTCG